MSASFRHVRRLLVEMFVARRHLPISPALSSSSIATGSGWRFTRHLVPRFAAKPHVVIRNGVAPDSPIDAPGTIAYLHLDIDFAGARTSCAVGILRLRSPGEVVVFDDHGWGAFKKQKV